MNDGETVKTGVIDYKDYPMVVQDMRYTIKTHRVWFGSIALILLYASIIIDRRTMVMCEKNIYQECKKSKTDFDFFPDKQSSPTSCRCPQLWMPQPLCRHSNREDSVPLHLTPSNHIGPEPLP